MSGFSRADLEHSYKSGFVEGVTETKEIIVNSLKDAIQNGEIVLLRGNEKLFDIVNSVGKAE